MIAYNCKVTDEYMQFLVGSLSTFGLVCLLDILKAEFRKRGYKIMVISDRPKPQSDECDGGCYVETREGYPQ